jgi:pilus assembly protein CpaE
MPEQVRALIVDAAIEEHQRIARCLAEKSGIEVVGSAYGGHEAISLVPALRPNVVLIDRYLPDLDGHRTTKAILDACPWVSVVILSPDVDAASLRSAGFAGASRVLSKPFTDEQLLASVEEVYHLGAGRRASVSQPSDGVMRKAELFTFYAARGGLGCTTLACNTAIALKQLTGKEVALFDCGLPFGDVALLMGLEPRPTIVDLLPRGDDLAVPPLGDVIVSHDSGVRVLLAPPSPEKAEAITAEQVRQVLADLRQQFDYVVIDTWPTFDERILHVLDASDKIVVPTTLEMPAIKNTKLLLNLVRELAYRQEKLALVLNRADSDVGLRADEAEQVLQQRFTTRVVSNWAVACRALNRGNPILLSEPSAPITADILALTRMLAGISPPVPAAAAPRLRGVGRLVRRHLSSASVGAPAAP